MFTGISCIYGHRDELLYESHGTLNSQAPHDKIQLPGTPLRRNFGCEQSVLRRTPPSITVHQEMLIQVSRSKSPFLRSPLDRLWFAHREETFSLVTVGHRIREGGAVDLVAQRK